MRFRTTSLHACNGTSFLSGRSSRRRLRASTTNKVKFRELCIAGQKHNQKVASPVMRMHNSAAEREREVSEIGRGERGSLQENVCGQLLGWR
jgi:hypothetical protein